MNYVVSRYGFILYCLIASLSLYSSAFAQSQNLSSQASQASQAYVYLQGTWMGQGTEPSVSLVINSPYVEIGEVLANVNYSSASVNCSSDLRRTGEDFNSVFLEESFVESTRPCPNGGNVSLSYQPDSDRLLMQSFANDAFLREVVFVRYDPNSNVQDRGVKAKQQATPQPIIMLTPPVGEK